MTLQNYSSKKLWWLVLLFSLFSCGKREYKKPEQPQYAIQVAIDSALYDVGVFSKDSSKTVSHTFKFTNRGDSAIHFTEVRTGCNCISYSMDKTVIAPRESLLLKINYLYSDNEIGYFNKMIYIILNNGQLYSLIGLSGKIK